MGPGRQRNADAVAAELFHGVLTVALVDGAGQSIQAAELAPLAAAVAARTAARRSPVWGVLAAAGVCEDSLVETPKPTGTIVVASPHTDLKWRVAWVGDSTAWTVRDGEVRRATTPHTLGERLRQQGEPEERARAKDHFVTKSLTRVPVHGVEGVEVTGDWLILASDGLAAPAWLSTATLAEVVAGSDGPQGCADRLITAAREVGSRDDVTVAVVPHPNLSQGDADGEA
jgi:serine/threonine protein phosphatase PrpC